VLASFSPIGFLKIPLLRDYFLGFDEGIRTPDMISGFE